MAKKTVITPDATKALIDGFNKKLTQANAPKQCRFTIEPYQTALSQLVVMFNGKMVCSNGHPEKNKIIETNFNNFIQTL